jgi:hypothetical protein
MMKKIPVKERSTTSKYKLKYPATIEIWFIIIHISQECPDLKHVSELSAFSRILSAFFIFHSAGLLAYIFCFSGGLSYLSLRAALCFDFGCILS